MKMRFLLDILLGESHIASPLLSASALEGEEETYELSLTPNAHSKSSHTIVDVPSYQKIVLDPSLKSVKTLTSSLYPGFFINLRAYDSFDSYFEKHFSGQGRRRNFSRQSKRLENEVHPQRRIFHGAVDNPTLTLLFDRLKIFLEKRFDQKEAYNYEVPLLPLYKQMFGKLLPKKNAIIFSLFDGDKVIALGIGFIHGKTLYLFNIAFDVDYARYGLGNQMMIDVVNWCFDNNIAQIDMGRGDFLHKRQWVNSTYTYTQINLYDPKKPNSIFKAYGSWTLNSVRYHLINFLKKLKVHQLAKVLLLWRYRAKNRLNTKNVDPHP